ncbi:MAG: hypothetical protein DMG68_12580 [Acidobacteria bacterium]|nr:MAG: hypothetical protein DMG68_12580 [Acidobacteriota bacterium]
MNILRQWRNVVLAFVALGILLVPAAALPQSCSLCYTQAASATQRFIQALRSGILILIIPPMFLSIGVMVMCYRKRNRFHQPDYAPESDNTW